MGFIGYESLVGYGYGVGGKNIHDDSSCKKDSVDDSILIEVKRFFTKPYLMEKQSSLEDTTDMESFPPLPMQVNTLAGNTPGSSVVDKGKEMKLLGLIVVAIWIC
nr:hypothetical protein [Tanacetum cinerariifolium]